MELAGGGERRPKLGVPAGLARLVDAVALPWVFLIFGIVPMHAELPLVDAQLPGVVTIAARMPAANSTALMRLARSVKKSMNESIVGFVGAMRSVSQLQREWLVTSSRR